MDQLDSELETQIQDNDIEAVFISLTKLRKEVPFPCDDVTPYTQLMQPKPGVSNEITSLLTLFELELWLFYSKKQPERSFVDKKIKSVSPLSYSSIQANSGSGSLSKYKYNDLITDYQHLYCGLPAQLNLMELVNKKLNFISSVPSQQIPTLILEELRLKILLLCLLSGSDFRKENVYKYLDSEAEMKDTESSDILSTYKESQFANKLTPGIQHKAFIEFVQTVPGIFPYLVFHYHKQLFKNFLESNICKLPRYYQSIHLGRINSLIEGDDAEVCIEDLLFQIIADGKLPKGSSIDQVAQLVRFGTKSTGYDSLNGHILSVCKIIDSICPQDHN